MHARRLDRGADRGDRPLRRRAGAARPAAARRTAHPPSCGPLAGPTVTPEGIGGLEALRLFGEVLAPACISVDHPAFLSFVPAAPTEAAILFDLVVGASSIYGGSWLEGGGAVFAENEALRWIADLAGLPASAGGVFVSGGTAGNLSALVAARWRWRERPAARTTGPAVCSRVGGRPLVGRPGGPGDGRRRRARAGRRAGRLTGRRPADAVDGARRRRRPRRLFAVVATRGTDERRGRRRPGRRSPTWPPSSARGCTSTAPTAAPRSPRRACATASTASSGPTASSSTRTSGCSRRSTRARCCTATRDRPPCPHPARRVPRRAARRAPGGDAQWNRPTTPTTCPGGPEACRSGSASPRTAPTPTRDAVETTLAVAREGAGLIGRRRTSSW